MMDYIQFFNMGTAKSILKRVLMIGLEPIMNYPKAKIVSSVSTYMN